MIDFNGKLVYLITEGKLTPRNFEIHYESVVQMIKKAVEFEVDLIQIREKKLSSDLLLNLTKIAVKIAVNSKTKILVNERFDIALIAKADGVHLTSTSIPVEIVRKLVSDDFIIGVSTHNKKEIELAKEAQADFVTYSPIFEKYIDVEPLGLTEFNDAVNKFQSFPIIALGGINKFNFQEVLNVGNGFASIGFLSNIDNFSLLKTIR
jgi:thiamine-phosphate pyrophosphorylase